MRLLIVEDEPDLLKTLSRRLGEQGYAVDTALDGEQGCYLGEVNEYDLLILDLTLPGIDGLEVARRLRASRPQLLILMLTARDRVVDRITGLDLGADDYLVKPFHLEELTARVRALLRREMRVRDPILCCGDLKLDQAARVAWQGNRRLQLTRKEFSILEYLMRHSGEVVSQEELLEHVWGAETNPFTNAVRVHINSVRRKLGDSAECPRYIRTAVGQGYQLVPGKT
jgi:DNA-binding response OmpR family regulator